MINQWRTLTFLITLSTCYYLSLAADSRRLPTALKPKFYKIYLEPYLQNGTIRGKVNILIEVQNVTNKIVLHSRNLSVTTTSLTSKNGLELKTEGIAYDPDNEKLVITLAENLKSANEYNLELNYDGSIQNDGQGLYSSSYFDDEGKLV